VCVCSRKQVPGLGGKLGSCSISELKSGGSVAVTPLYMHIFFAYHRTGSQLEALLSGADATASRDGQRKGEGPKTLVADVLALPAAVLAAALGQTEADWLQSYLRGCCNRFVVSFTPFSPSPRIILRARTLLCTNISYARFHTQISSVLSQ
jgi:hypothetical protein